MGNQNLDDYDAEIRDGFVAEVKQCLDEMGQCFLNLENNPNDPTTMEEIFRGAHNIKGGARVVGLEALAAFAHEFESLLLKCKNGKIVINKTTISVLLKCVDHLGLWTEELKSDFGKVIDSTELLGEIQAYSNQPLNSPPPEEPAPAPAEEIKEETQAITIQENQGTPTHEPDVHERLSELTNENLSNLTLSTEPPPTPAVQDPIKPPGTQHPSPTPPSPPVPQSGPKPTGSVTENSIRVSLSRLESLINYVGELVILQAVLSEQYLTANPLSIRKTIHQLGKATKEVRDLSMGLRMMPLKQTFQKMQRIVRDTSTLLNKKIQFTFEGEATEVDKTILESLTDPLVHLVRNAIDHGIEDPIKRLELGKPEAGSIHLKAFHKNGKLIIQINDDGRGISSDHLRKKAIEKGILSPTRVISETEALNLIFYPGFSTKEQVSEVSGRGVGLDVVKTNINKVAGEVLLETTPGKGSTFKIVLPLTLAIIDGMVIKCADEKFVIPLVQVYESVSVERKDLRFVTGLGEVLMHRGENIPIIRLSQALNRLRDSKKPTSSKEIAIIIRILKQPFATLVDDIIGQYQVVIKKLGSEVGHLKEFSGSAILGDGKPALILELTELFLQSSKLSATRPMNLSQGSV